MKFVNNGTLYYTRPRGVRWDNRVPRSDLRNMGHTKTVGKRNWFCEAVLWLPWVHRGCMGTLIEAELTVIDAKKIRDVVLEHQDLYVESVEYAQTFLTSLKAMRNTHGCAWDLPREVIFPNVYAHAEDDVRFDVGNVALEDVLEAEALQA